MNWEQMFAAINGLAEASLMMRAPGHWYVSQPGVSIAQGVEASSGEKTPEAAVTRYWSRLTNLTPAQAIEYKRGRITRRVRWTGFFWSDVATAGESIEEGEAVGAGQ